VAIIALPSIPKKQAFNICKGYQDQQLIITVLEYNIDYLAAFTLYRGQGQTIEHLCASLLNTKSRMERYVILSRVRTWDHLLLMDECELNEKNILGKGSADIEAEIQRLDAIYERTRQNIWKNYPKRLKETWENYCNKNLT
jgi:hypothetical protein